MYILATAVLTASLLGSMHCVGMCGPLAIWASGAADQQPRTRIWLATGLYHAGRFVTYVIMGAIAGLLGELVDFSGEAIGIQVAAARVVGAAMVVFGVAKLWTVAPWRKGKAKEVAPSAIGGLLVRLRPYVFRLPLLGRAFATGLLTTFLPCGWLYLFALIAAGTGSVVLGPLVMAAFWLGTVPALTALVAGTRVLSQRFNVMIPVAAALLLVVAGCYTAAGRGFANIESLSVLQEAVDSSAGDLSDIGDAPLPCCCETE
tara:strand:- start:35670 stop:36449 length:780 start_codon:yes stop_codon:yes gene_type:complete